MPQPYLAPWTPGSHLHAYNRACDNNLYFRHDRDRHAFLRIMGTKVAPFVDVLSYNLIPNHWHANLELLTEARLREVLRKRRRHNAKQRAFLAGTGTYEEVIAQVFRDFGNSYSSYLRVRYRRRGRLAGQSIRRVRNTDNVFHRAPVAYVLLNHLKHGVRAADGEPHPWTSLHQANRPAWVRHDLLVAQSGGEAALRRYLEVYLRRRGQAFHALDEEQFFGITLAEPWWEAA